jgi:beta-N-acetylglucosaminidase
MIKINHSEHFKISLDNSSTYMSAKNRFKEILEGKLGIIDSNSTSLFKIDDISSIYENVKSTSSISGDQINKILEGTDMEGLGSSFVNAQNEYGVNALFLVGLAIHESGYGTSRIAKEKNNLFGFGAYDSSPYSSAQSFETVSEGINQVAKYLSNEYLTEGGKYFSGNSIESIGKKYATDPNWSNSIKNIMSTFF